MDKTALLFQAGLFVGTITTLVISDAVNNMKLRAHEKKLRTSIIVNDTKAKGAKS